MSTVPPPPGRRVREAPRARAALLAGRAAATASRVLRRGSGEVVGGKLALRLDPGLLPRLALGRAIVAVSGTNGKTTTTRLLARALGTAGAVATNAGGANMTPGVVTALAAARHAPAAALEVDEIYLPRVAPALRPRVVVLLNLTRDQLDRSNETRRIAGMWRALGASLPDTVAVANADDPLVAWAALGFGRQVWVAAGQRWDADAHVCPACGSLLASAGGWSCPSCGLARPAPAWVVRGPRTVAAGGVVHDVELALPGEVNTGNAAMAAAAAGELGVAAPVAFAAMRDVAEVQGRYQEVSLAGRRVRLLLAKNPAGWLELLALLEQAPPRPAVIHFHAREADGRDPSWLWDVPLERLAGREVHVSGDRAADVGVRLAYAGVPYVLHPSAQAAVAAVTPGEQVVDVLATYTAFRELVVATR